MSLSVDGKICVVVPNWNGKDTLAACLDSLQVQSLKTEIVIVENGSVDGSVAFLEQNYPHVTVLSQPVNLGFAGGVNVGIRYAIKQNYKFVALLNNDAVASPDWLSQLVITMQANSQVGITTSLITDAKGRLDSTGEFYSNWGLPYSRGRGEASAKAYAASTDVFAASGGASLYRVSMLEEIGLFDEDFFAYYEDVDLSFRAQLVGWKVAYQPKAMVVHQIGATSSKIKGFTTYQTMKNQPLLLFKNVPRKYLWTIGWRFFLAHCLFFARAVSRGQGWVALKGDAKGTELLFSGFAKRKQIQATKKVSDDYIWSLLIHDLPPNAHALRKLRARWWKISGKGRRA